MLGNRLLIAPLILAASILACASPIATQSLDQAATSVAQTLQALPLASPASSDTPAPLATPSPSSLLPHSLYFLNAESGGRMQVFKIGRDGHTSTQITFEPADVDVFDVSPMDGSVAYISNNQMLFVDAGGAGRRMLVDGGPVDDSNRFTNSVGTPVFSPDGSTIAFSRDGLNFYTLSTGAVGQVLQNQIDNSSGFPIVRELYAPNSYSPDGTRLLINIGFYEGGTFGIYYPSNNALLRFKRADGGNICCRVDWVPDGSGMYVTNPTLGMVESGLYYATAATGDVATLLPGSAPDGTYNFADSAQVGADGKLYFFFNNLPTIPASGHTPLFLVRSASDGVSDRMQLLPDAFNNINEVLWAPDASLAIVAAGAAGAGTPEVFAGGQAQIVYPDGRPTRVLAPFVQQMKWGP